MADNEPPQQPDQPDGGFDPEQLRQFQEFQRFQEYQRFVDAQRGQQAAPDRPAGELVPARPTAPAPQPHVANELAGLRQQLAELTAGQQRIERATNPPWWRRLLRGRLVHWLIALTALALLAIFGIPALINHYFGGSSEPAGGPGAALPAPKSQSHELITSAKDAVAEIYRAAGVGTAADAANACFSFDQPTALAFARTFGAASCPDAMASIHQRLQDPNAYSEPDLTGLPNQTAQQTTRTISSCDFDVSGGPRLGTFTLTRQTDGGWEITGYAGQQPCPTPSGSGSATPTS